MTTTSTHRGMETKDIVLIALFCGILVALGSIPPLNIGIIPVPITSQTLGVMLAGAILGPVRGAASSALFVLLVVVGLPVLAGGRGGLGIISGPTGGYLLGWIPGAFVVGLLAKLLVTRTPAPLPQFVWYLVACIAGGIIVVYAIGIPWSSVATGISLRKAAVGALYFVLGDLIKAVITSLVARSVRRVYPIELR
jgi:biotin transport system substrate-specific component